jgi:predicted RNA binding protein YcfA (HicA-like mRNA interferase family)
VNGRALIRVLKANGWLLGRIRGSHHIIFKNGRRAIAVPGSKDLPKDLVKAVLTQAEREKGMK